MCSKFLKFWAGCSLWQVIVRCGEKTTTFVVEKYRAKANADTWQIRRPRSLMVCQRRMSQHLFCSPQCLVDDESHRKPPQSAELRPVKGLVDRSSQLGEAKRSVTEAQVYNHLHSKTAGQYLCPCCNQSFSFRMHRYNGASMPYISWHKSGYHQT